MKKVLPILISSLLLCFLSSCKTKSIDYMKNIEQTAIQTSIQTSTFTIQPGDQLVILVSAKDNDVVRPFNKSYSSSEISQFSIPSNNLIQTSVPVTGPTYVVDSKGNIDFPVLGELNTSGKTIEQFRDEIKERLKQYVKDPGVNIRTVNFKITVLGEVNKPGAFTIPDGQSMTLLAAIGYAGDLTIYGRRENVLIVRNVDGNTTKQYINLSNADFINSPYYYVKQNDVIYVSPNNTKKNSSGFGPQATVFISIASVVVGLLAILFR